MSRLMILILVLAVILLGVVFHLRNDQLVVLDYIVDSKEFYLSIWLVVVFTLGVVLGILASLPLILKLRRKNAKLQKQVRVSEKEINNLRVIPLKDKP